jgi:hypothetical protein
MLELYQVIHRQKLTKASEKEVCLPQLAAFWQEPSLLTK